MRKKITLIALIFLPIANSLSTTITAGATENSQSIIQDVSIFNENKEKMDKSKYPKRVLTEDSLIYLTFTWNLGKLNDHHYESFNQNKLRKQHFNVDSAIFLI